MWILFLNVTLYREEGVTGSVYQSNILYLYKNIYVYIFISQITLLYLL